jgi:RNA polymerase sigma-70 factor (ECF subfamily)
MVSLRAHSPIGASETETRDGAADATLVGRILYGERAAASDLYRRHVTAIYDFCAHRLGSREAAEDATQTVFLRAFAGLERCKRLEAFRSWLFGIAHHVVVDEFRARRHEGLPLDTAGEVEDRTPSPERLALAVDEHDRVRRARARLSPADAVLFDLLQQELTDTEIAQILGKRHGAVRTAHYRLRRTLRGLLGDATSRERSPDERV